MSESMSETTAFLAGTAIAGVSALLLLKGGLGLGQSAPYGLRTNPPTVLPPAVSTQPLPSESSGWSQSQDELLRAQLKQQETLTTQLRAQLEQQEAVTTQLRSQLEQQRNQSDRFVAQLQDQQRSVDRLSIQQGMPNVGGGAVLAPQTNQNSTQVLVLWAIAGFFLLVVVVGGVLLLVVVVLASQSSRRQRPSHNYILHNQVPPDPYYPPPPAPQRPRHTTYVLPQRNVRRVDPYDV